MPTIKTHDGTAIYYRDWGSGPPVVFSHGWPLTGAAWEAQMLFFNAKGYRTIAHDRRGNGSSDQPGTGNDVDTWADDLAELMSELNLRGAVLVGHSTGGGELARYISRHGTSRVAKVVLLDSIVPAMMEREGVTGGTPKSVIDSIRAGVAHDRSSFYKELSGPFFGANRPGSPATQGMRDLFWFQGLLGGAKAQYETTYSWELDYTSDIAKCNVPLLVIHCEDDQIVPIGPTGRRVPSVVPHAILKVYPGGAHGIAITEPEKVNADLLAFVKGEMKA
ncbi:MAG: alpha/beta hydrolase [Gammaproteobacteria bacterium]|nr:alpha/beta hydrolase [Gammaproteobacteria bacterium]